jgi:hypothetical protein
MKMLNKFRTGLPYLSICVKIFLTVSLFYTNGSPLMAQASNQIRRGGNLPVGESIWSLDRRYQLTMQKDGNLVLYRNTEGKVKPIWSTGTNGKAVEKCVFQTDGNWVLYSYSNRPLWASGTNNKNATYVQLQNDGNLVIYNFFDKAVWASGTSEKN